MEVGNGISIIAKVMNHLVLIKEKLNELKGFQSYQILATKNGEFINYKPSVYKKRQKEAQKIRKEISNLVTFFLIFLWGFTPFFCITSSSS